MIHNVNKFAQAYSQAPWRKQIQMVGLILLCLLFVVLVSSIYLNLNARVATYGREILLIQEEIQTLELINADLHTQLGILKSSAFLRERAIELGFIPIEKGEQIYIVVPGYLEGKPKVNSAYNLGTAKVTLTLPPIFTESLLDWFLGRFHFLDNTASEVQP